MPGKVEITALPPILNGCAPDPPDPQDVVTPQKRLRISLDLCAVPIRVSGGGAGEFLVSVDRRI